MAGRLIALLLAAQVSTSTSTEGELWEGLVRYRSLAKIERSKRDEARDQLAACIEERDDARELAAEPVVREVEVEVMPTWGWIAIAVAGGLAVGAGVTAYVIARE